MRAPLATSPRLGEALALVRNVSAFLASDRPLSLEMEAAAGLVASGEVGAVLGTARDDLWRQGA